MKRRTLITAVAAVLAGCATAPRQQHRFVRGRFAMNSARGAITGRFALTDFSDGTWMLDLRDPLGTTVLRLDMRGHYCTAEAPGYPMMTEESAEALTERVLGFALPLEAIRGMLGSQGAPASHPGWQVSVQALPTGAIRRLAAQSRQCRITLVADAQ